jgi:hypothetical protein
VYVTTKGEFMKAIYDKILKSASNISVSSDRESVYLTFDLNGKEPCHCVVTLEPIGYIVEGRLGSKARYSIKVSEISMVHGYYYAADAEELALFASFHESLLNLAEKEKKETQDEIYNLIKGA